MGFDEPSGPGQSEARLTTGRLRAEEGVEGVRQCVLRQTHSVVHDLKEQSVIERVAPDLLGLAPEECAVIEDAESGVKAGASGPFALVVGVDRGVGREALTELGADVIVDELDELIPALERAGETSAIVNDAADPQTPTAAAPTAPEEEDRA